MSGKVFTGKIHWSSDQINFFAQQFLFTSVSFQWPWMILSRVLGGLILFSLVHNSALSHLSYFSDHGRNLQGFGWSSFSSSAKILNMIFNNFPVQQC